MRLRHTLLPALASVAVVAALASPAAAASHSSVRDSDHDGMSDRWELSHKLNPKKAADAKKDADKDGLTNLQEFRLNGNPRSDDTDGDGVDDAIEAKLKTKLNRTDSDGDGVKDGDDDANRDGICDRDQREARGRITSFDETTGDLTVATRAGGTTTYVVTDDTEIEQREHRGWAHRPGGHLSQGPRPEHSGDDADSDDSDDSDDSVDPSDDDSGVFDNSSDFSDDDDWTEGDADDMANDPDDGDDLSDNDVVDPLNVELLAAGTVVLKVKVGDDGFVSELRLA